MSCVTSSGCRLDSQISGGLVTLKIVYGNFMRHSFTFCEEFGHRDFINRLIFVTVFSSMYCICHLWVVGSCV